MSEKELDESCPKCKDKDIVFEGNWTGVMVSDIYSEHFWMAKVNHVVLPLLQTKTRANLVQLTINETMHKPVSNLKN